jgi:hypothetical protein
MDEQQRLGIPGAAIDQMNARRCRHKPDPICRSRHRGCGVSRTATLAPAPRACQSPEAARWRSSGR